MTEIHPITKQRVQQAGKLFFEQATSKDKLGMREFAVFAGVSITTVTKAFENGEWSNFKDEWLLKRIREAMDALYPLAKTQDDFSAYKIADYSGISRDTIKRIAVAEWRARKSNLPTARELALKVLQEMVDANVSIKEFTIKNILAKAGVNPPVGAWLSQPFRDARLKILKYHANQIQSAPEGQIVHFLDGIWVDLASDEWDLRPKSKIIRKSRLRADIADISWSLLCEEARLGSSATSTIGGHYKAFCFAGNLLGSEVPELKTASLEAVQRAWQHYVGTGNQLKRLREALVKLFIAAADLANRDTNINQKEMLRIASWLELAKLPKIESGEDFLSDKELDALLLACLKDIKTGIEFASVKPDLLNMSTIPKASENASDVVYWAIALLIIVAVFTGLRRGSIVQLKTDDWVEIRQGLFALNWHHGKKREENLAVLPSEVVQLLKIYVLQTEKIRSALETSLVFLVNDRYGLWSTITPSPLHLRLCNFVKRHQLERAGKPLNLSFLVFRRTYITRQLNEGRSIWALRSQLGHKDIQTTLIYAKFERFEHPSIVGSALDQYGRKALSLWHKPLILRELDATERISILNTGSEREQEVGLCRHSSCIKAKNGSPPPCSLCEHLVTGPEFLDAWQQEYVWRQQELSQLREEPASGLILAQKKFQLEHFEENLNYIKEKNYS